MRGLTMKKKIKLMPMIFTVLLTINIAGSNFNSFKQFEDILIHKYVLKDTTNVILLEAGDNSSSAASAETSVGNTGNTSGETANSGNISDNASSTGNGTSESTNENNSSETVSKDNSSTVEPTQPTAPAEPNVPVAPAAPTQSTVPSPSVENRTSVSGSSTSSTTSSNTSTFGKSRTQSSTSTSKNSTSTNSSISTSKAKDTNENILNEDKQAENAAEQPATSSNNNQSNTEEAAKNSNLLLIKANLDKGNVNLNDKSNEIKLTSDDPNFKEIYYVISKDKNVNPDEKWVKYSAPLKFDKNGIWYIHYKAVDKNNSENYGYFGPYNVVYNYQALEANAPDSSVKKKIIGFSMIAVIVILAVLYIIKTNKSPYPRPENK